MSDVIEYKDLPTNTSIIAMKTRGRRKFPITKAGLDDLIKNFGAKEYSFVEVAKTKQVVKNAPGPIETTVVAPNAKTPGVQTEIPDTKKGGNGKAKEKETAPPVKGVQEVIDLINKAETEQEVIDIVGTNTEADVIAAKDARILLIKG